MFDESSPLRESRMEEKKLLDLSWSYSITRENIRQRTVTLGELYNLLIIIGKSYGPFPVIVIGYNLATFFIRFHDTNIGMLVTEKYVLEAKPTGSAATIWEEIINVFSNQ